MIIDAGDDLGVRRLDEERADSADEGGGITYDRPRRGFRSEQSRIALVLERAGQRVRGMGEEPRRIGDDAVLGAVDGVAGSHVSESIRRDGQEVYEAYGTGGWVLKWTTRSSQTRQWGLERVVAGRCT